MKYSCRPIFQLLHRFEEDHKLALNNKGEEFRAVCYAMCED